MKILIISHFLPYPPHGGSLQRNFSLLKETAKNHDIHFLTFTQRVLLPDERKVDDSMKVVSQYCRLLKVFKIPTDYNRIKWYLLLFLNLFSLIPYSVWRYRSRAMIKEVRKQLREEHFDLIQSDTIALAQYAMLAPDLPKILVHQNVESSLLLRRSANEKNPLIKLYLFLQGKKLRRYERKVAPNFDINITVSETDKLEFEKIAPQTRFEVVPNATDTEYFKPQRKVRSKDLIFAGGLTWYPNKDAMLYFCNEIFPLIKKKLSGVKMNIIGRYPPREVQRLATNDSDINLLGYVNDVRAHIAEAAVYVVPIRVGGGTRLKILDAMAMGKAIVSTSIGAEGLDVEDGKNILIADDPQEFADKTVKVLTTPVLRQRLEQYARETVKKKYSWETITPRLQRIYSDVVSSKMQYH
jgi:sugar transferase (PEP-CTERM/EpsH1 system associated)